MEKVILSKAARKSFGERLNRDVPDPNTDEFDELLEELREMQPDAYTDLVGALEYSGDKLPVEKEALRAHNRAQRQKIAHHLKNRETHDGKSVPDKRKSLLVGGIMAALLMGWIGYTNISRAFTAQAASTKEPMVEEVATVSTPENERLFGVRRAAPDFDVELDTPQVVRVVQTAPLPPPKDPPQPVATPTSEVDEPARPEPAGVQTSLPFGLGRPLKPVQTEPGGDLPPAPSPPQPGVANAPPASPYLPPASGGTDPTTGEPTVLPTSLSFDPPEATAAGPTDVLGQEQSTTELPSTPGTTLTATSESESTQEVLPPPSLGGDESEEPRPAASTLSWEDASNKASAVDEESLSFAEPQEGLSGRTNEFATSTQPLPPVPQVGGATQPPPATPEPGREEEPQAEPEVTDLGALLTPGTQLEAQLVTGVAATDGAATPVIAKTTGDWCGEASCSDITWIGEANYFGADRVELTFSQAVVGNTAQSVSARAFGGDQLPGVPAGVRDAAPTAVQDLLRGAFGGAADYLDAFNSRETVILREGEVVRQQAEPDLGTYLLGRGTELFSLPSDQTSILRLAEVAPGTPFTVIYGL